jgi:hypothetical protein
MVADMVLAADSITGLNDNDLVLSWPGTGKNTAYQGTITGATAPTYKTAVINGRPVVRFPGNQLVKVLSLVQTAGMSMITVARLNAITGYGMIMSYNPPGGWELRANGSSYGLQYVGAGGGFLVNSATQPLDSWHILEGIDNSAASLAELYVDGSSVGNIVTTAVIPSGDLWLGQRTDGYAMNGDIAEAIMVCADLSVSDRQKIEGYLADKYGLQANLPAGHPYKSSPPFVSGAPLPPDQSPTRWELMAKAGDPGPAGATGPQGPPGLSAHTQTTANFTVPVLGGQVTVNVADTSWIAPGQFVYVDTAGGAAGKAGSLQVVSKTATTLVLKNSSGSVAYNFYDTTPTTLASGAYTVGLEFTVTQAGSLYSISFYKDSTETSNSRSVGLWNSSGTLLASATSSGEPSGPVWIHIPLSTPYPLVKATTYIVGANYNQAGGYTNGNYPTVVGPISGTIGRYIAASGLTFPANSYNAIYGTDLTFIIQTSGSALPGAIVASGSLVGPSGDQGPAGPPGTSGGVAAQVWGETPAGAIDGSNLTFTSAHPYTAGLLAVFLNGLRMRRSGDYNETGAQTFQFVNAPLAGDTISIDYIQP